MDLQWKVREVEMTSITWVVLVSAIVLIGIAIWAFLKTRTKKLRSKFGPEYDRVVSERGSALTAERELEHRAKRVENFQIRPLSADERDRFANAWRAAQERFVDDPRSAMAEADQLVHTAMKTRGYPIAGEFDERAADLSVEHPGVVEHYRAGHAIVIRDANNQASTEDLRVAMKHYRALFEDLLGRHVGEVTGARK
jgi:hypothetical protein